MSKKSFKSQASSSRAASTAFGLAASAFGSRTPGDSFGFGATPSSPLSYIYEPPNLASISDAYVVVAFKNLQKKDSTTKAKALEELHNYVSSLDAQAQGVEDAVLESWICLYPRVSIDNDRRVRQLCHQLQGKLSVSCGKRLAKHMPNIIGVWLAGLYDNDKPAARAARKAFEMVFASAEKQQNVWRLYQASILDFSSNVLMKEDVYTLSDERITNPDDAMAKYNRVLAASVQLATHVVDDMSVEATKKASAKIVDFLEKSKPWRFASSTDPAVRRTVYRLLATTLRERKDIVDPKIIGADVLKQSLQSDQTSSALELVKLLAQLTKSSPELWSDCLPSTGKKSATHHLARFMRKGSHGGPRDFWPELVALLQNLPHRVLIPIQDGTPAGDAEADNDSTFLILEAFLKGINNKDEPRINQDAAWNAYLDTCELILNMLQQNEHRQLLLSQLLNPLIQQFLKPNQNEFQWTIRGSHAQLIVERAARLLMHHDLATFEAAWKAASSEIRDNLQISLPEQSQAFCKSQDTVLAFAERWYGLQGRLLNQDPSESAASIIKGLVFLELEFALKVLESRNGKPYGSAAAVNAALRSMPAVVMNNDPIRQIIHAFASQHIPKLVLSVSATYLISMLDFLPQDKNTTRIYESAVRTVTDAPQSPAKSKVLTALVSSPRIDHLLQIKCLHQTLKTYMKEESLSTDEDRRSVLQGFLRNPAVPLESLEECLADLTESLNIDKVKPANFSGLHLAFDNSKSGLKSFITSKNGQNLIARLLQLAESSDEDVAQQARNASNIIEDIASSGDNSFTISDSILVIIKEGVTKAHRNALPVESLLNQARKLMDSATIAEKPSLVKSILPTFSHWATALKPFLMRPPNQSLAIMQPLRGAVNLIERQGRAEMAVPEIDRDGHGYSSAFRMAMFTVKWIKSSEIFALVEQEQKVLLSKYFALFLQLSGDNVNIAGSMPLWNQDRMQGLEPDVLDLIADTQTLLASWIQCSGNQESHFIFQTQSQLLADSHGMSALAYYSACAYANLTLELNEQQGVQRAETGLNNVREIRKSPDIFTTVALILCAPESNNLSRLCNELVADATGIKYGEPIDQGLRLLILLNSVLAKTEESVRNMPQQRLVFFVKHVVSWLVKLADKMPLVLQKEIINALLITLPPLKDIYGSFWEDVLSKPIANPTKDQDIAYIHTHLRLFIMLSKLKEYHANDDLLDAWTTKLPLVQERMLTLLKSLGDVPDESHLPRKMVNELLARQLSQMSFEKQTEDLFPVLAAESGALQQAAYAILHHQIPQAQEQVSMDKALSKDVIIHLPDELLSLILAAPTLDSLAEASFERTMPHTLRGYLLSWKLVFDHWSNASHVLQADYVASLKDGTYLQDLLSLISSLLISRRSKPVNASKFEVESYEVDTSESPEHETHWLLIHLYYLCLRHTPQLTKTWWRDSTSRQTMLAVETWTEKYISPLIIASELKAVSEWAPNQPDPDQPLNIKVSQTAREITASIPVDEQTMAIAIRLPPSYPLARATVDSVHRVGVDEKKWKSWLITTQGVINFPQDGGGGGASSLIEGLLAWKKNVAAKLKGQTECAICYSVISEDRQLPTKKCQTCKQMFHSLCLFRWFSSSNSSSCPLCRNSFNYA